MICPHCHKELDQTPAAGGAKRGRPKGFKSSKAPFDKEPFPSAGQSWSYHTCYFAVGDSITWKPRCDRKDGSLKRGEIRTDTVAKIKRNQFGRVSYYTQNGELVLMEEVQEAI